MADKIEIMLFNQGVILSVLMLETAWKSAHLAWESIPGTLTLTGGYIQPNKLDTWNNDLGPLCWTKISAHHASARYKVGSADSPNV